MLYKPLLRESPIYLHGVYRGLTRISSLEHRNGRAQHPTKPSYRALLDAHSKGKGGPEKLRKGTRWFEEAGLAERRAEWE